MDRIKSAWSYGTQPPENYSTLLIGYRHLRTPIVISRHLRYGLSMEILLISVMILIVTGNITLLMSLFQYTLEKKALMKSWETCITILVDGPGLGGNLLDMWSF